MNCTRRMGPATEMSGGSVANTVAGFANLGGRAAYIGKVKADQLGTIFNHDMRSLGVDIRLAAAKDGAPTARSHVLITPNGQRTMQTYLGACVELGLADITAETIGTPKAILLEGYVWDIAEGPDLAREAARLAKSKGAKVALSLSDSFCVERHRDSFVEFVSNDADIIVADEEEVAALLGTGSIEETLKALSDFDNLFAITRSEHGSVIVDKERDRCAAGVDSRQDRRHDGGWRCLLRGLPIRLGQRSFASRTAPGLARSAPRWSFSSSGPGSSLACSTTSNLADPRQLFGAVLPVHAVGDVLAKGLEGLPAAHVGIVDNAIAVAAP